MTSSNTNYHGGNAYWVLEKDDGKPIKLHKKKKLQQFQHPITHTGQYAFVFLSKNDRPGPRFVEVLVQVFTNIPVNQELPPISTSHKERLHKIHDEHVETNETLFHSEVMKISSGSGTVATKWEITKETELPARVRVVATVRRGAVVGMKLTGRLFRDPDWFSSTIPANFIPDSTWIYEEQTLDDIDRQLKRESPQRQEAFDMGLIRPFMMLVSMHPFVRCHQAEILGIDFTEAQKGDPHVESLVLLTRRRKGLSNIADHTYETVNPLSDVSNWYHCLYRSITCVHRKEYTKLKRLGNAASLPLCKDASSTVIPELELKALRYARQFHRKVLHRTNRVLAPKVNELMADPELAVLFQQLHKHNIHDKYVHRFVVEMCVLVHFNNWKKHQKSLKWHQDRNKAVHAVEIAAKGAELVVDPPGVVDIITDKCKKSPRKRQKARRRATIHRFSRVTPAHSDTPSERDEAEDDPYDSEEDEEEELLSSDDEEIDAIYESGRFEGEGLSDSEDEDESDFGDTSRGLETQEKPVSRISRWKTRKQVQKDEEDEQQAIKWKSDKSYNFTAAELLKGLFNQLKKGNYDPQGYELNESLVGRGAKGVAKKGVKYMIAVPLSPLLIFPYSVANLVVKFVGSDHVTLWTACIQIVLQRVLLAIHDIDITPYYRPLSDEYDRRNQSGDIKHSEHSAWKKQKKKQTDSSVS